MNKFQKLAQLNRDIELLESAGKIKAADILHQKFIKEAQYMMPQMMPMMMNPMMYSMMPRPVVNPGVTSAPMPVAQPRTTQVQTTGQTPGVTVPPPTAVKPTPTTQPTPVGQGQVAPPDTQLSYNETPSRPVEMGIPAPPIPPTQTNPYDNYYKDPRTGKIIFVDPGTGEDIPGQGGGTDVMPPGTYGKQDSPPKSYNDPMEDPRVKQFMQRIMGNDFLSGKQKEQMINQYMRSIGLI